MVELLKRSKKADVTFKKIFLGVKEFDSVSRSGFNFNPLRHGSVGLEGRYVIILRKQPRLLSNPRL